MFSFSSYRCHDYVIRNTRVASRFPHLPLMLSFILMSGDGGSPLFSAKIKDQCPTIHKARRQEKSGCRGKDAPQGLCCASLNPAVWHRNVKRGRVRVFFFLKIGLDCRCLRPRSCRLHGCCQPLRVDMSSEDFNKVTFHVFISYLQDSLI